MCQIEKASLSVLSSHFFQAGQMRNARPFLQSGKELPQSKGASRDSRSETFPWDDVWKQKLPG